MMSDVERIKYCLDQGISPDTLMNMEELPNSAILDDLKRMRLCIYRPWYGTCLDTLLRLEEFHRAAILGDVERMQHCLDQGISVDYRDFRGFTPLHLVSLWSNSVEAIELLVANKCDLDARTNLGETALTLALSHWFRDGATVLIKSGADVNCCNIDNWNALHLACGDWLMSGIVRLLVGKVSDINAVTTGSGRHRMYGGDTALSLVLSRGFDRDIVELLLKFGANVRCGRPGDITLLHCAAERGWTDIAAEAILNKCDLNARIFDGRTALMLAAGRKNHGVVSLLLKHGADIYLQDNYNETALFKAIPCVKLIKIFINGGAYLEHSVYTNIYLNTRCRKLILRNRELCTKIVINEYNSVHLPAVYQMYSSVRKLPLRDSIEIRNNQSVISDIKTSVDREIQMKTFCNVMEVRPLVLQMLAVRSLITNRL